MARLALTLNMATRNYIYTNEHPYHVWNRTNNRVPYPLPLDECWRIYCYCLKQLIIKYDFNIYAFVMMNNHYHLLGQCSDSHGLNEVMHEFQMQTTNIINKAAGRINRLYGGPYQCSLIKAEYHYANVFKYVLQNPLRANLTNDFRKYKYSSHYEQGPHFKVKSPMSGVDLFIPTEEIKCITWLNEPIEKSDEIKIRKSLRKRTFKVANLNRKPNVLNYKLV